MALLAASPALHLGPRADAIVRALVPGGAILFWSRPVLDLRCRRLGASILIGLLVFLLWIAPDELIPGYRDGAWFQNGVVGHLVSSVPPEARGDWLVIVLRIVRGVMVVPVVEELFWRGWLPRWIDRMDDFQVVPVGRYTALSFVATALLFAVEHGSFWDVGLAAGLIYNGWMAKTKNLGDLILAHAVTNGCLAIWVLATGQWRYW